MKIVISGERKEGKTTLLRAIAQFLVENGWGVIVEHSLPLQELKEPVDLLNGQNPRCVFICEEQFSDYKVWNGMVKVDDLGKMTRMVKRETK